MNNYEKTNIGPGTCAPCENKPPMPTAAVIVADTATALNETCCILNDVLRVLTGRANDMVTPLPPSDRPPCLVEKLMFVADRAYYCRVLSEEIIKALGE